MGIKYEILKPRDRAWRTAVIKPAKLAAPDYGVIARKASKVHGFAVNASEVGWTIGSEKAPSIVWTLGQFLTQAVQEQADTAAIAAFIWANNNKGMLNLISHDLSTAQINQLTPSVVKLTNIALRHENYPVALVLPK